MITIHDVASGTASSVERLTALADRLTENVDFVVRRRRTRSGRYRRIVEPFTTFDSASKNLYKWLDSALGYSAPEHVHGFVRGKSTVSNASQHLSQSCVLRVDLQEFFPSIDASRVAQALKLYGLEDDATSLCLRLVCLEGRLPIGLSTSPMLSNIVFEMTDHRLAAYCQTRGLNFTRYVDDLRFSGSVADEHLAEIKDILHGDGWIVNDRKTAFMRRGGPQYVTGLYVGCADGPRIPRRIKRQMRWISHIVEKFGYESYMDDFGGEEALMRPERLLGWAKYIAAVEPDVGFPLLRFFDEHVPLNYVPRYARDVEFTFNYIRSLR
jgi:RNA-directed DNA polymerase